MKCSEHSACQCACLHRDTHLEREECWVSCADKPLAVCQHVKLRGKALGGRLAG